MAVPALAYQHINLTQNPFGSLSRSVQTKLAIVNNDLLQDILIPSFNQPNHILQLLAPQGYGKSTHLLALHTHYLNVPYAQRFLKYSGTVSDELQTSDSHSSDSHFIDSMENLAFLQRLAIYRRYKTLAVTSTNNFETEMRLCGRQVTTVKISLKDSKQLLTLLNERIEYFKRDTSADVPKFTLADVSHLQSLFHNDIRRMTNALYDCIYKLDKQQLDYRQLSNLVRALS